jgi:hypothetical protein
MPCLGFDLRTSQSKEHECLASNSTSGPPNVRNTHVLPGIRSCSSSQDIHAPRFRTGAAKPLPFASCLRYFWTTPSVDARSRRRDVLAPSTFIHVATGTTWSEAESSRDMSAVRTFQRTFLYYFNLLLNAKWYSVVNYCLCCWLSVLLSSALLSLSYNYTVLEACRGPQFVSPGMRPLWPFADPRSCYISHLNYPERWDLWEFSSSRTELRDIWEAFQSRTEVSDVWEVWIGLNVAIVQKFI